MVSDFVLYRRSSSARLMDPNETGFPFYAQQNRRQRMEGLRLSVSKELKANSVKVGGEIKRIPLSENFVVAATDPAILDDPTNPVSQFTLANPFTFNEKKTGTLASWFAQDRVKLFGNLTIDAGVRYDHYDLVVSDDAWSPRVGLAYFIKPTGTVLRASYNRLFQTPPTENLLLSSAPEAAVLSPLAQGTPVPAERQNAYEFGLQQQIGTHLRLDVSRYVKNIQNFSDKDQFLETGIIFPIAIARGDARGTEVRLDLADLRGFTGFLSYANSKSNGTTPLVGGLFLGEAGSVLLQPGFQFPNDHDQRNTGQFNVTYTSRKSAWVSFGGRYDSGVPTDVDPAELPFLDPRIAEALDGERGRIKPRAIFDIAGGYDLFKASGYPVSLQLSVNNLFNDFYLFNFESVFSGTHIGRPREVVARLVFHFHSEKPSGAGTHGAQP
jgi:outer membrane receptor protein involved in Fe transport